MEIWNQLNLTNNIQSDIPQYYFYYNNQLGIYPRPASGYNPITIRGQVDVTNNTQADLTETKTLTVPYVLTLLATTSIGDKTATLSASQTLTINAAVNALVSYAVAGTKVIGAQVASIGLNAKSDTDKITDIIAALRAHGLLGPNA